MTNMLLVMGNDHSNLRLHDYSNEPNEPFGNGQEPTLVVKGAGFAFGIG